MAMPPSLEHANTVGWYILEGYPWWPVYICDQYKLRPNLHLLGDGHKKILKKSKDFHRDYALVYYFGSHDFSLVKLNKGILKPWDCSEKEQYLKGHPKHLIKKGSVSDDLSFAIQEVEDYLSQPEDMRLPPHMVPSDLDPTLEPPPPVERVEEEEEEDGEDDDEPMASDAEGGGNGDEDADADADMDGDDDGSKKKKASQKKPAEKKKEKKPKKEKETKEKKPAKEKKEKKAPSASNEKKTPPVKEKKTPTKEKKPAASKAKKAEDGDDKTNLKRQRSSSSPNGADESDGASESKLAKKDSLSDVKTDGSEDMAVILEREIRWILSNEQYEEMTTKMLRKVLEERLKRDLKQHRETIKAVVTRVIEEEEDVVAEPPSAVEEEKVEEKEDEQEEAENDPEAKNQQEDAVMNDDQVKRQPSPEPVQSDGASPAVESPEEVKSEPVKEETKDEPMETAEAPAEPAPEVVTPDVAPPKPVDEDDILTLKEKLSNTKTPHDELLASLAELQQMSLEMSHLKHTGIARVVAGLRQHANDKVSIAAKNLRNAWMQLADKGQQPNSLKKLEKMNEILESETEPVKAKLVQLHKLIKMSLSTQEIIDSKIGVVVSKLRKSSNPEIMEASQRLRKKWKKEAAAP